MNGLLEVVDYPMKMGDYELTGGNIDFQGGLHAVENDPLTHRYKG